ncbi:MAG: TraR/DksA family transcriptional regulator [Myxococcales bacterium]|nr:TraR/DksA family transcriptional regulator [Myxococcales bacterium]
MSTSQSPAELTPAQLAKLRARLLAERDRLREDHAQSLSPLREPGEPFADAMDSAESSLEQHEALGRSARDRRLLVEVEHAIEKIQAGTYGVSEVSGEPLGYARLEAVPWARLSTEEQELAERESRGR